jgi:molecular chaperone GrpE (heat shock protein)
MEDKQKTELIKSLEDGARFALIEPFLYELILLLDRLDRAEDEFSKSVRDELFDILQRRGLERIEVKREFDPRLYKAVRVTESAEVSALTVTGLVRRGYVFSGRVIRPAEVVVVRPTRA